MIVCQCKGTTDRQVRDLVRRGVDSVAAVGRACGAGTDCAGCIPTLLGIIAAEKLLLECQRSQNSSTLSVTSDQCG